VRCFAPNYFPGMERWNCKTISPDAPAAHTSGLCQPPIHAVAVQRIWEVARYEGGKEAAFARAFLDAIYPSLLARHRYRATDRDPEGSGLVSSSQVRSLEAACLVRYMKT
jgi:hypothetical protein